VDEEEQWYSKYQTKEIKEINHSNTISGIILNLINLHQKA